MKGRKVADKSRKKRIARLGRRWLAGKWFIASSLCVMAALGVWGCDEQQPVGVVVCLGDSLTVCGGSGGTYSDWIMKWLPRVIVINEGVNRDTIARGRRRFERDVLNAQPHVVVIALGTNDYLKMRRSVEELRVDLEDMVVRAKQGQIEVVIISCFGGESIMMTAATEMGDRREVYAREIGRMEAEVAQKYGCLYVPDMQADIRARNRNEEYWQDRYHPNRVGNRLVAKRILPAVTEALARAARH